MECRKHEPRADERTIITVSCGYCDEEFTADEARTIAIFGPDDVLYTCPQCGHGADGPSPILSTE